MTIKIHPTGEMKYLDNDGNVIWELPTGFVSKSGSVQEADA